ncbi:MAG: DNA polymerase III subunit beta [Candidatus Nealsonbacteria bacterium]|nr:DNA polymerase III subunit beta [Candidatus Nealsonbacteria bacterium]
MKFIILKENLNKGLNIVSRVTGKNSTLPILNNILIDAQKNFLNLSATDLELGIKYWSLIKTEKEGKITIPAKILSSFINLLPEDKIYFELKNQIFNINCQSYQTKIKGLSAEDFPIIPKIENNNFIQLDCQTFCKGLSQVVDFASQNQTTKPELSGVYLNFGKDTLSLTTTDSFRLAEKILFFEEKNNQELSLIIPQRSVREIINILSEKEGKLRFYFSTHQVLFEYFMSETDHPEIQLISRLIDGDYPDYQEIIPKKYEIQTLLSKEDFLNHVKTASIFSGKTNEIKIIVKKDGIEILSQNPEFGENKSFLSAQVKYASVGIKEMEVSFNYRFLIDGLLNIKGPEVIFELNGEGGPAVLKPKDDTSYIYIVMPIKST